MFIFFTLAETQSRNKPGCSSPPALAAGRAACEGLINAGATERRVPPVLRAAGPPGKPSSFQQPLAAGPVLPNVSPPRKGKRPFAGREGSSRQVSPFLLPPSQSMLFWFFFLKSKNQKPFLASFQLLFSCSAMAISSRQKSLWQGLPHHQ